MTPARTRNACAIDGRRLAAATSDGISRFTVERGHIVTRPARTRLDGRRIAAATGDGISRFAVEKGAGPEFSARGVVTTRLRGLRACAGVVVLVALAACTRGGGGSSGAAGVATRDSAGIRIVDVRVEPAEMDRRWGMRAVPEFTTGETEGGAEIELFRVNGVRRMGDGRLLIADGGTRLLLVDPRTRAVRTFGRKGRGPGEFEMIAGVWRGPGDSLYVYDLNLARVTPFSPSAGFGSPRAFPPVTKDGFVQLTGRFPDGTFLGSAMKGYGGRSPEGVQDDSLTVLRVGPDTAMRTIARLPFSRSWVHREGPNTMVMAVPFEGRGMATAWGDGYLLGDAGRYELRRYGPGGRLEMVIRRAVTPAPVTGADVERTIATQVAAGTDEALVRRIFAGMPIPRHFPVVGRILPTADGGLWVQDHPGGDEQAPATWTMFARDGSITGRVTMPAGARVFDVMGDRVAAVVEDEDEVQRVTVYRLEPIARKR